VKIRTRAFIALWVITILVAGTIAFILIALNIAGSMDAERQRVSEVLNVHGSLWRTLVELKHDQDDQAALGLPSAGDRLQSERSAVDDYFAHEASLVSTPGQRERLQQLKAAYDEWSAIWAAGSTASSDALRSSSDAQFAPVLTLLAEFDARERDLWNNTNRELARRREVFFFILAGIAAVLLSIMAWLISSSKRVVLDPLTELTDSAQRIERGDFTTAHQTLREDEIGVLINSFAKMVHAVRARHGAQRLA
jgi:nitrate/nitrite-specific signal transduction histidine kinase